MTDTHRDPVYPAQTANDGRAINTLKIARLLWYYLNTHKTSTSDTVVVLVQSAVE